MGSAGDRAGAVDRLCPGQHGAAIPLDSPPQWHYRVGGANAVLSSGHGGAHGSARRQGLHDPAPGGPQLSDPPPGLLAPKPWLCHGGAQGLALPGGVERHRHRRHPAVAKPALRPAHALWPTVGGGFCAGRPARHRPAQPGNGHWRLLPGQGRPAWSRPDPGTNCCSGQLLVERLVGPPSACSEIRCVNSADPADRFGLAGGNLRIHLLARCTLGRFFAHPTGSIKWRDKPSAGIALGGVPAALLHRSGHEVVCGDPVATKGLAVGPGSGGPRPDQQADLWFGSQRRRQG